MVIFSYSKSITTPNIREITDNSWFMMVIPTQSNYRAVRSLLENYYISSILYRFYIIYGSVFHNFTETIKNKVVTISSHLGLTG